MKEIILGKTKSPRLLRAAVIAIAGYFFFSFVLIPARIRGSSMEPSYRDGGFIFLNALSYFFAEPSYGDVVAIRLAGPKMVFLKRIVGKAGDSVAWMDGRLLRNGEPVPEPYVEQEYQWNMKAVKVGEGKLYVVGDNRAVEQKAHSQGRIDEDRIIGAPLW